MKRGRVIPFAEARRLKASNRQARWSAVADSFTGEVWPQIAPSFRIAPGQTVFTIGSCFARNIEGHLETLGCRVPMMEFHMPPSEWSGAANGAMNKFHPPAFRQVLEWTASVLDRGGRVDWSDCETLAFDCGDLVFDMDMGATLPVSRERFLERRQHIYEVFRTVFSADALMMTPGLIEAWRDRQTGLYIHEAPTLKAMVAQRDRWELEILSIDQCRADLLAAIDIVRTRNPGVKVLVTTSPVPMVATFSGQDVRVANSHSKSVLRAICGEAALQRPMTDYFPSYECVTLSRPEGVWLEDRIHVTHGFIGKIVAHMLSVYVEEADPADRLVQQARTDLLGNHFAEAEAAARRALEAQPEQVETREVLAEALLRQYKCDDAEAELKALLKLHGDRADLWIMLARAIARGDRTRAAEAIGHVETAVALPTMSLTHYRSVAELVRRHAPPKTAERIALRMIDQFPLNAEAYEPRLDQLLDQGRKDEAIELLRQAVTLRRAPAKMFVSLAELTLEQDPSADVRVLVENALAINAKHPEARALLARLAGPRASS